MARQGLEKGVGHHSYISVSVTSGNQKWKLVVMVLFYVFCLLCLLCFFLTCKLRDNHCRRLTEVISLLCNVNCEFWTSNTRI